MYTSFMQINLNSYVPPQTQIAQQEAEVLLRYQIAHQIEVNRREVEEIERKCRIREEAENVQGLRIYSLPVWLL